MTVIVISDDSIVTLVRVLESSRASIVAELHALGVKMSALDDEIAALTTQVSGLTTVATSAEAVISGIGGMVKSAVDAALAAGAPQASLDQLMQLGVSLDTATASLAAAVANTPATEPPVTF